VTRVAAQSDAHDTTVAFRVDVTDGVLRVAVAGELDLACADLFDGLFDLPTEGIDSVVLDLGGLTFCDVSGANALTGLRAFHLCGGRSAWFANVTPPVRRLMALTDEQAGRGHLGGAVG
jgi:anti-sigma B factor antagonist